MWIFSAHDSVVEGVNSVGLPCQIVIWMKHTLMVLGVFLPSTLNYVLSTPGNNLAVNLFMKLYQKLDNILASLCYPSLTVLADVIVSYCSASVLFYCTVVRCLYIVKAVHVNYLTLVRSFEFLTQLFCFCVCDTQYLLYVTVFNLQAAREAVQTEPGLC